MSANDRAVDHQVLVVAIRRQRLEHTFPNTGMTPSTEALVYRLPFAIALRQVTPVRARAQNPKAAIDKYAVVRPASAGIANLTGKQRRDRVPLSVTQFIPLRRHQEACVINTEAYESSIN